MPKQRQPIREVIDAGDHQLVFEVPRPTWRNRELVMEEDAQLGAVIELIFDEEWRRLNADCAHVVARSMYWELPLSVQNLLYVAEGVRGVLTAQSGSDDVIRRIKSVRSYDGAIMEARVAHRLRRLGIPFRFVPPVNTKCHDFDLLDGSRLALEVKTIEHPVKTEIAESMTQHACEEFPWQLELVRGKHFSFTWDGWRVLQIDGGVAWEPLVTELGSEARERLLAALKLDPSADSIELEGLGTVDISKLPANSSIVYFRETKVERAERRVYRSIRAAKDQLPTNRPGVVVLCPRPGVLDHAAALDAVERALKKCGAEHPHVVGVVVLSTVVSPSAPRNRTEHVGFRQNPHGAGSPAAVTRLVD